ncbi:hypothetical protein J7J26_02910 [Candidatus Micrarchaeota archaeon]|nr:hypothetical protein [Candidatus Micrarchaeota archaeon]
MAGLSIPKMPSARPLTRVKLERARKVFSAIKRALNEIPGWGLVDDKDLDLFFTTFASQEQALLFSKLHEKISYGKEKLI